MNWKDIAKNAGQVLDTKLLDIGGTTLTVGTLLTAVLIVIASFVLSWMLQRAIQRGLDRRGVDTERGAGVVGRLLHYLLVVVGLGVALQTAGIRLGALFAAGAVFAVGIGFAMQNITQNFVSGVILLVERSIKPGDILQIEGEMVRIVDMGIRSTLVRTLNEENMIVPNATIVQSTVKNYTARDPLYRLRVVVGVTYSSDMSQVRRVLEAVAAQLEWRETSKDPRILLTEFGSSSVDWEVSVWIMNPWDNRQCRSLAREAIWNAFKAEGIVIAFPQLDVHFDAPIEQSFEKLAKVA